MEAGSRAAGLWAENTSLAGPRGGFLVLSSG